jgi:GT2 family glycosyltransferase
MRDQNQKVKCLVISPFYEWGQEFKIGDIVEMNFYEATRFGGAGIVRLLEETWSAMPESVSVSAIVLLYETPFIDFHQWVVTFLSAHRDGKADAEIVVVENTGHDYPDRETNLSYARALGFKVIVSPDNLGFAGGCNLAAEHATGDVLVFLNDDMAFKEAGWLDVLIEPLRTDPLAAVCGADLQRMDGGDWRDYDRPDWVCGACFAVRRFDFLRFGGFDERYFFSWEETDYCRLVTKLGYKIVKTKAKAWHQGGETATNASELARTHFERGSAIFGQKWGFDGQGSGQLRIVGSMLVGNEMGRFLEETLAYVLPRVCRLVIVDDASTDGTAGLLEEWRAKCPEKMVVYRNKKSMFREDEHLAREDLHYKALKEAPDWILPLDADEELSKAFDRERDVLVKRGTACDFPIVHYWGDRHTRRVDGFWGVQSNVRFYPVRWDKKQDFYCQPLHCGSAPLYAYLEKEMVQNVALLHKGWERVAEFEEKKKRNQTLDPSGYWEPQEHLTKDAITIPFEDTGDNKDFR